MINILLVDDEKKICEFIKACLDKEGYNSDVAYDGKSAISYFEKNNYDIVILDRMIPDISGEKICEHIRSKSNMPIIMLTSKVEDEDRIEGFKLGCDDYICKPFNVIELVLRIKSILKRINIKGEEVIKFGNFFELSKISPELKLEGKNIYLTNTEYKILLTLASNPKKVYSREELLENTVGDSYEKFDRVIDSHIKNLRQKIEIDSSNPKIIQTVYGMGYKFGIQ